MVGTFLSSRSRVKLMNSFRFPESRSMPMVKKVLERSRVVATSPSIFGNALDSPSRKRKFVGVKVFVSVEDRLPGDKDVHGNTSMAAGHQPRATSRVIMTANPAMAPSVAMSVFFSNWDSGMSSSTTT